MVALPSASIGSTTVEDNVRLYGLAAALVAGRREFGTYDALPDGAEHAARARASTRPRGLFLLADGVRVAARLAAIYPGIDAELRWAGEVLRGAAAPPRDLLDLLLALALRQAPPTHAAAGLARRDRHGSCCPALRAARPVRRRRRTTRSRVARAPVPAVPRASISDERDSASCRTW